MDRRSIIFVVLMTAAFFIINNFLFPPKPTPTAPKTEVVETAPTPVAQTTEGEERYVLENSYQQLVISTVNGALAEINLPLQSSENRASVIKPTLTDSVMATDYPEYDQFPTPPYRTHLGESQTAEVGGYYPLIRRNIPAQYYTCATTTDNGASATTYRVTRFEKNVLELEGKTGETRITKTYTLPDNPEQAPYSFDFTISVRGDDPVWLSTGVPEVEIVSGSSTQSLKYRMMKNQKGVVEQISLPKTSTTISSIRPDWVANSNGFFQVVLNPVSELASTFTATKVPGTTVPTRLTKIDAQSNLYPAEKYPGYDIRYRLHEGTHKFHIFAGPLATSVLEKNDQTYHGDLVATKSFHGWFSFISEPFAKFLFFLMKIFYSVIHSWGFSIILLTIALRLMLYPLNAWSIKSTVKMQKLAPKLSALQERYKKDPKKAQAEMMNLYREHGVNPLGGCFPLLIQMPFLIGMFDLLKSTFELRGTPFIPGWITNLAAPDVVFTWSTPIWFIGNSFHLLPILLGVVMFFQQRMSSSAPKDPKQMNDQQRQQRLMGNLMTIVFTVLFYNFPSGLNLYWLSSMLLGILQQWWMTKRISLKKRA